MHICVRIIATFQPRIGSDYFMGSATHTCYLICLIQLATPLKIVISLFLDDSEDFIHGISQVH